MESKEIVEATKVLLETHAKYLGEEMERVSQSTTVLSGKIDCLDRKVSALQSGGCSKGAENSARLDALSARTHRIDKAAAVAGAKFGGIAGAVSVIFAWVVSRLLGGMP